eukprot:COSAG02_NODE_43994_length_370_cov_0.498155_1_plen_87_part_10
MCVHVRVRACAPLRVFHCMYLAGCALSVVVYRPPSRLAQGPSCGLRQWRGACVAVAVVGGQDVFPPAEWKATSTACPATVRLSCSRP